MKDEEIDKMADDFVNAQEFTKVYGFARRAECGAFWKYGFLAGLKAGRPQWHDLRKDPNDLPRVEGEYFICYQNEMGYKNTFVLIWEDYDDGCHWLDEGYEIFDEGVIAWCEIPTFDKE